MKRKNFYKAFTYKSEIYLNYDEEYGAPPPPIGNAKVVDDQSDTLLFDDGSIVVTAEA